MAEITISHNNESCPRQLAAAADRPIAATSWNSAASAGRVGVDGGWAISCWHVLSRRRSRPSRGPALTTGRSRLRCRSRSSSSGLATRWSGRRTARGVVAG
jgi:hypothetical protein